jgi:dolichol-phosphate mannosyltransferase
MEVKDALARSDASSDLMSHLRAPEFELAESLLRQEHPDVVELRRTLAVGAYCRGSLALNDAERLAGVGPGGLAPLWRVGPPLAPVEAPPHPPGAAALDISVVVPMFNEEPNIGTMVARVVPVLAGIGAYEVIFVDDGSRDRSVELVLAERATNPNIKLVRLSRNFGHQAALSAGIEHTLGRVVVLIDADLQDPPEVIPQLMDEWRKGAEVVYAVREKRKENLFKRSGYYLFYRLLRSVSSIPIPLDSGDFCLMDTRVVDHLLALPEKTRFLRGLRSWVGFRQVGLRYERAARSAGEPKYTLRGLMRLAVDGLISFTVVPLRVAVNLGLLVALAGLVLLLFLLVGKVFGLYAPQGWTSLTAIILSIGGIQLLVTGVLGEYVGRVYDEVKGRPVYIVGEAHGAVRRTRSAAAAVENPAGGGFAFASGKGGVE